MLLLDDIWEAEKTKEISGWTERISKQIKKQTDSSNQQKNKQKKSKKKKVKTNRRR